MFGDVLLEYLFRVVVRGINLCRSFRWPKIKGTVLSASCPNYSAGCPVATIDYEYRGDGVKYADAYRKPFLVEGSTIAYTELFVKGSDFEVQLKPGDPSVSVSEPRGWARM